MSDNIKIVLTFALVLLAGIGLIVLTEQYLGPKAVLTQQEKPPAKMEILIVDNEVWIRLLDMNGQSTKYPGNMQIELSRITDSNARGFTLSPLINNVAKIDHFDMIYYNVRGVASNIYAATTEVNMPLEKGLYRINVKYYPRGEDYSLSEFIVRGV